MAGYAQQGPRGVPYQVMGLDLSGTYICYVGPVGLHRGHTYAIIWIDRGDRMGHHTRNDNADSCFRTATTLITGLYPNAPWGTYYQEEDEAREHLTSIYPLGSHSHLLTAPWFS